MGAWSYCCKPVLHITGGDVIGSAVRGCNAFFQKTCRSWLARGQHSPYQWHDGEAPKTPNAANNAPSNMRRQQRASRFVSPAIAPAVLASTRGNCYVHACENRFERPNQHMLRLRASPVNKTAVHQSTHPPDTGEIRVHGGLCARGWLRRLF